MSDHPHDQEGKSAAPADEDELDDDVEDEEEIRKPLRTTFELADTLYAEAELEETDTVYLWLGVRSLLSFSFLLLNVTCVSFNGCPEGKCDAIVQDPHSYRAAQIETGRGTNELNEHG